MPPPTPAPIRVGIGGWTFPPWRGPFYPDGLRQKDELHFAARAVTAIEINATYYGSQKPATFAAWGQAVPDGFKFALKASRYCTNRKILADAGESIERFLNQGIIELGDRLGPILWQFMPTKRFDPDDFAAFLKLLPTHHAGHTLHHAFEVRHESFVDPAFYTLAHQANAAIVFADSPDFPQIDEATADFAYARLMDAHEDIPTGYAAKPLERWSALAQGWAKGGRDTYIFMINGAKVRAPAAAQALIALLD